MAAMLQTRNRHSSESKGSAFVWYSTCMEAAHAILSLHSRYAFPDAKGEHVRQLTVRPAAKATHQQVHNMMAAPPLDQGLHSSSAHPYLGTGNGCGHLSCAPVGTNDLWMQPPQPPFPSVQGMRGYLHDSPSNNSGAADARAVAFGAQLPQYNGILPRIPSQIPLAQAHQQRRWQQQPRQQAPHASSEQGTLSGDLGTPGMPPGTSLPMSLSDSLAQLNVSGSFAQSSSSGPFLSSPGNADTLTPSASAQKVSSAPTGSDVPGLWH
jgi:hypothetical protein